MHDHSAAGEHHHHHTHGDPTEGTVQDRNVALLSYMVSHNRSHAAELQELASNLDGNAADLISEAVILFNQGNDKLDQALELLKEE